MKLRSQLVSALVFLYAVITLPAAPNNSNNHNTINAVLGDVSFVKKFGKAPNEATNERLRIQTHLTYVEALLRKADVAHLSPRLRERRSALLDKLHDYRLAGEFPTNLDFPQERRPCFIDAAGNICAVGYLIEQTAGRALAERITAAHKYDFLVDMAMPELTAWVEESGLTARECAMIQPSYNPRKDRNFIIETYRPTSVQSFTSSPYHLEIRFSGLPAAELDSSRPPTYMKLSLYLNGKFTRTIGSGEDVAVNPAWSIFPTQFIRLETSATMSRRWNGVVLFTTPMNGTTINGVHALRFESSAEPSYIWYKVYATEAVFVVHPLTSTRDLTLPSPITISPNPTNDVCMLALPENELHRVRLTNSLGTAVATLSEAAGTTALDVSALAAGIYFVEVESRTTRRRWVQKMVKY